jgi:hypothetical protein
LKIYLLYCLQFHLFSFLEQSKPSKINSKNRSSLESQDFDLYLANFNLSQHSVQSLSKKYQENIENLKKILIKKNETSYGTEFIPHYKSLEWRLDMEIDRRNIRKIMNPKFIMNLETSQDELLMSADYQDLKHCCNVLETALKEIKSNNVRRIKQYIK